MQVLRTLKAVVIDVAGLEVHLVGHRLEEDGGGRDLLLVGLVAVRQVTPGGQVQAHDTVMRVEQGSVDGKVGRRARVGLYINAPFLGLQPEGLQRALDAKVLDLMN